MVEMSVVDKHSATKHRRHSLGDGEIVGDSCHLWGFTETIVAYTAAVLNNALENALYENVIYMHLYAYGYMTTLRVNEFKKSL